MERQENKVKHLEMIESIIERMPKNSFQLKAWAVTLVTIVGALGAKDRDKRFLLITFIPIIGFWILDSYYIQQERRYKILYQRVCENLEEIKEFSLDTNSIAYNSTEKKRISFIKCFLSISEISFYGILAISILMLVAVLKGCISFPT